MMVVVHARSYGHETVKVDCELACATVERRLRTVNCCTRFLGTG
jgi:hypothetical protein